MKRKINKSIIKAKKGTAETVIKQSSARMINKMLKGRGLELFETKEAQAKDLKEIDRIAKMLVRRDLGLSEMRERREKELKELERRTKELEDSRSALMNILDDVDQERKMAEQERDRTETIVSSLADGLLLLEKEKITLINPQAQEFFNLAEQDLQAMTGKKIWDLGKDTSLRTLIKLLKKQGLDFRKVSLEAREGLTLEVSSIPLMRAKEETGRMIILHDVTREQFIEQMKTEFVTIAAHQLRTPISAIKWILRMLVEGDVGKITAAQKDYLEKAYQSNERMIRLINDLLNVTRVEEGKFLYNIRKEDIVEVIEKTLKPFQAVAKRKGIGFELNIPKERTPKLYLDAEKIGLAVQNLVDNAVRYTEQGKVSVSIDYQQDKKEVIVKIEDTGIGIPKSQHQRVFSRFFRASNAIKTETSGTGLGLFIAKNIIEAHQGSIWFESVKNKGATFYFALPLKKRQEFEESLDGF